MKRRMLYALLGLLVISSMALASCGPAEPKTVIIGATDEISSLDFSDAYATHDWELMRNCNRALTEYTPGTAEIVPGLAESWDISADGLTYTFHLGSGWMYPDGTELKAADIANTINRALALEGDIHGVVVTYVASAEATDDSTLVITLVNPRGDFPQIASMAPFMPTPEGSYPADELNRFPDTLVGVGPWQITSYDPAEQVVMERNPNYKFDFDRDAPDTVIIRYFEDATQMALAIENGEIDIAWRILGPPEVQRLGQVEGLTSVNTGGGGIRYLVPNHAMEPFTDKSVRQAIAYLVDRDELVDRVMSGTIDPLYSMVPPGFLGANETFLTMYNSPDVAAAEALLEAAGYTADNPLTFDLWYPPEHYGTHAAQIFQVLEEQMEATDLIEVTLQVQEWGTYVHALTDGEYPIGYLGWFFDYPDTSNYLDPFALSAASPSMGINYASTEMDNYLNSAGAETDATTRETLYTDAQELYATDVVTIPLTIEPEYAVFRNATVESITIGPALVFNYELIELK
ncbi:MAG: ABC transporter substrate-binding protein [Anaerolineales bacterium]|jgi:peptide/nickel transport system substrate-binding protein